MWEVPGSHSVRIEVIQQWAELDEVQNREYQGLHKMVILLQQKILKKEKKTLLIWEKI